MDLNAAYTSEPTLQVRPSRTTVGRIFTYFMAEASYEFEHNSGTDPGVPQIRRGQTYWSNLSGATGQLYGVKYTWQFIEGGKDQLDTPGARQMEHVTALFEPRTW